MKLQGQAAGTICHKQTAMTAKRNTSLGRWSKYTNKANHVGEINVIGFWFNTADIW